jgi:tetratricopeptide (TPR) repeat protein
MQDKEKKYILRHQHDMSIEKIAGVLGLKERKVRKFLEKERSVGRREVVAPKVYSTRVIVLCVLLIIALGFGVYANTLGGKFIWDDELLVRDNVFVKDWSHRLAAIFTSSVSQGTAEKFIVYRPLQILSYAFDYHFWRLDPTGYHLANIFLHVASALGIFWLLLVLFENVALSLGASLLFVVHPVHTGAVSYISGRADPLALVFLLLAFIFYVKESRGEKRFFFYVSMLVAYAASLLSRETGLVLPFLLLAYHGFLKQRPRLRSLAPVFFLAVAYVALRTTLLRSFLRDDAYTIQLGQRLPGVLVAFVQYLRLLCWPRHLHMQYSQRLFSYVDPLFFIGLAMLAGLAFFAWRRRGRDPVVCFGVAWFLIAWLAISNIFPLNAYMAEHWLYLPSIGFFLVLGHLFSVGFQDKQKRVLALTALAGLCVFYGALTIRQNSYWQTPQVFFERTLAYAPDSPRILRNLGRIYLDQGRYQEAVTLYQRALTVTPDEPELYIDLGGVYEQMGEKDRANSEYQRALALYEKEVGRGEISAVTHNNLGFLYAKAGDLDRARDAFKKAIAMDPYFVDAHNNLNAIAQHEQTPQEVIAFYQKTAGLDPDAPEACYSLGSAYEKLGQDREALRFYEKAVLLNPDYAKAYVSLGGIYQKQGRISEAQTAYQKAIQAQPEDEHIAFSVGVGYQKMGRPDQAIACYQNAIRLNPDNPRVYANMGAAYFAVRKTQEALAAWNEALRLDPKQGQVHDNLGLAYQQAGRLADARAAFLKAVEISPRYMPAYAHLIVVDKALDQGAEAQQTLEKALALDPSFNVTYKDLLKV